MTLPAEPSDAAQAVQAGLHAYLTGDFVFMSLVNGVYDEVPEGVDMPYVTLRDTLGTDDGTHSSYGENITLTFHTWTRALGNSEGNAVGARLYALLHRRPLALDPFVSGHNVELIQREFRQSLNDPAPGIRHRVDRYRIRTSQSGD